MINILLGMVIVLAAYSLFVWWLIQGAAQDEPKMYVNTNGQLFDEADFLPTKTTSDANN